MSCSDILCIYIQFPIIKREYECRVNLDNHFQDILEQLFVLKISLKSYHEFGSAGLTYFGTHELQR